MDPPTHLLGLPNEIILYILRQFLDLGDVWGLLQVSRKLRYFAMDTIHKRWKIDPLFTPATMMKIQCRAALIELERLSTRIPIQQQEEYYRSPVEYDHIPPPVSPPFELHHDSTSTTATTATTTRPTHDDDDDDDDEDDDDDSAAMEDLYQAAMTMRSTALDIGTSFPVYSTPEPAPPTLINVHEFLLTVIDCGTNSNINNNSSSSSSTSSTSTFDHLLLEENRLHQRIIQGISACKHKYVLIEDIDIRNRIRATVDVIFHHTVFVSASMRQEEQQQQQQTICHHRNLAVMMVRLLVRLDAAFPSYCREITYTLVDHIKAFLEYTGYKLLGQRAGCLHGRDVQLHSLVFGATEEQGPSISSSSSSSSITIDATSTTALSSSSSLSSSNIPTRCTKLGSSTEGMVQPSRRIMHHTSTTTSTTTHHYQPPTCTLPPTLYSMAACFDLMGAAFIGKVVSETHVECAVQRVCELLTDDARHVLGPTKRLLLMDLLEGWLALKRGLMANDLCRFVQSEIDRC